LNFKNPRWRTAAILKTVKSSYLCNRLTDFEKKLSNRHIYATVWPILMKFGRVTHIGPLQRRDRENYEVFEIQHGCGLHLENRDISMTV